MTTKPEHQTMLTKLRDHAASAFTVEGYLKVTEKVSTFGIALCLLHFVVLPASIFAYVAREILSTAEHQYIGLGEVRFTTSEMAVGGFYWLMSFWAYAVAAATVAFSCYMVIRRTYRNQPMARAVSKAILAIFLTSGTVERIISTKFVPLDVKYAPKFELSLYFDLGALVRSPVWDFGRHSLLSNYTWLPLVGLGLSVTAYLFHRIAAEVKSATRDRRRE